MARPAGEFDASRYFRGDDDLGFYNVGTSRRASAGDDDRTASTRTRWTVDDAMAFADALIVDRVSRGQGASASKSMARYRRAFTPRLLPGVEALAGERPLGQLGDDRQHLRRR